MDFHHISVLPNETIKCLKAEEAGLFIDCTLGAGGHSGLILGANSENRLIGLDVDESAHEAARKNLSEFDGRFELRRLNFGQVGHLANDVGPVNGILMDIGVSSHQIDTAIRGFSYRFDGPLDMRMDHRIKLTASYVLNTYPERELRRIFREYGEEKLATRIARAIVQDRDDKPWERTQQLADLIYRVAGKRKTGSVLAPARVFQALRIEVNGELEVLKRGLESAFDMLAPGGRLAVITFHSLEDRIVKKFFKSKEGGNVGDNLDPLLMREKKADGLVITRKPITATEEELAYNSRSSCAKLRCIEKL